MASKASMDLRPHLSRDKDENKAMDEDMFRAETNRLMALNLKYESLVTENEERRLQDRLIELLVELDNRDTELTIEEKSYEQINTIWEAILSCQHTKDPVSVLTELLSTETKKEEQLSRMMEYYTMLMARLNNMIQRDTDRKRTSKAILELIMGTLCMSIEDATLYLGQFTRQLELDHQTAIKQLESAKEINKTLYDSALELRYITLARKVHIRFLKASTQHKKEEFKKFTQVELMSRNQEEQNSKILHEVKRMMTKQEAKKLDALEKIARDEINRLRDVLDKKKKEIRVLDREDKGFDKTTYLDKEEN